MIKGFYSKHFAWHGCKQDCRQPQNVTNLKTLLFWCQEKIWNVKSFRFNGFLFFVHIRIFKSFKNLKEKRKNFKGTLREFALRRDHLGSAPKQDQERLRLPKSIPSHLMMRKAASQPCYRDPEAFFLQIIYQTK